MATTGDKVDADPTTELEVSTDGHKIVLRPVRARGCDRKLEQVVQAAHEQYAGVFRQLAE